MTKGRQKEIIKRGISAQRRFAFAERCDFCVRADVRSANGKSLKALLSSLKKQTFPFSELLLLCGSGKALKLSRKAAGKNAKICFFENEKDYFAAAKETKCDFIADVSAPLGSDCLFRLRAAVALHPLSDVFVSESEGADKRQKVFAFKSEYGEPPKDTKAVDFGDKTYDGTFTEAARQNGENAKICAGMVLFNPDIELSAKNAENIIPHIDKFFFVDNGSENVDEFEKRFEGNDKVAFIRNGRNAGIALSLNRILDAAADGGFDWVLTLDQDTVCDGNMIDVYKRYIHLPSLGIISPQIIQRGSKTPEEYKAELRPETELIFDFDRCITSASLTNVRAAKKVGGFNDELFIDAVDFEINQKLLMNGYLLLKTNDTYIVQEIGERIPLKFIGFFNEKILHKHYTPYYSVHSDFRLYYISRNYRWFLKKYKVTSPTVNRRANFRDMLIRFMLYPKNRSRKAMLKAVRQGRRDSKKMTY